ncbi:MAG: ring-cleaving dioxygenase [Anaerolineae bacterium]
MELKGLHHVTAVTGSAQANVDFYMQVLGLRLVKRTVNQDDVSAYHLFYGDETGSAGTEITFFEWAHMPPNVPGPRSVVRTSLRVPSVDSLAWWADWLSDHQVNHGGITEFAERKQIVFTDPEGQALALVDDGGKEGGTPWAASPVPAQHAIRGLDSVHLAVHQLDPTAHVLTEVMGLRKVGVFPAPLNPEEQVHVYETAEGGAGTRVHVIEQEGRPAGRLGHGGVHHVAFRTPNGEEQIDWMNRLRGAGLQATDPIDRFYFRSVYFREPGGILYEIATDGPGFATDEDAAHLGESLALPPFLEPHRARIEAGLNPIELPVRA